MEKHAQFLVLSIVRTILVILSVAFALHVKVGFMVRDAHPVVKTVMSKSVILRMVLASLVMQDFMGQSAQFCAPQAVGVIHVIM